MAKRSAGARYTLTVPLDASGVEDLDPEREVKILVVPEKGAPQSEVTRLDRSARATAVFGFAEHPGTVKVIVGPGDAGDDELVGMQTISVDVPGRQWLEESKLALRPIAVTRFYWHWWLRWCRWFTVRGRVVCADGTPVPGAVVTAYDTDYWWWWCSKQAVGSATTDLNGTFEINFRWCCGWWPWWWWAMRHWHVEPLLAEKILPVLYREPKLKRPPIPEPDPDPLIFDRILAGDDVRRSPFLTHADHAVAGGIPSPRAGRLPLSRAAARFDPSTLEKVRGPLAKSLPPPAEAERLRLWPWFPWNPWSDCTPDIIFRATQECEGGQTVIVDETCWDTRHDIPTTLDVTLVANENACCIPDGEGCLEGECLALSHACGITADNIGGNVGAPATPEGFVSPGSGDQPFAGLITISGTVDCMTGVDYYEFQWSHDGIAWNDVPSAAAGAFGRSYIDFSTFPFTWGHPLFSASPPHDGRFVYPTLQFYEANNPPANWGSDRIWVGGSKFQLMNWLTNGAEWADGVYHLRVRGWNWDAVAGTLVNPRVLKVCGSDEDATLLLTLDNRTVGPSSGHPPSVPSHPVTALHAETMEPDTDILAVQIVHEAGPPSVVQSCGSVPISEEDLLVVDFMAYDPDGHLSGYSLNVTWGENQLASLLNPALTDWSLAPMPGFPPVPAAAQVGPTYADARSVAPPPNGGAVSPIWQGGALRLTVRASEVFPVTCCYQLELAATKRTIVDCGAPPHRNDSAYSFAVTV